MAWLVEKEYLAIVEGVVEADAGRVERAVAQVLKDGVHGADLGGTASTEAICDAVIRALETMS